MTRFALRNLVQRKTRTALSVAAIGAQVAFVLLVVGLCMGTLHEAGERIENIRSDVIILPPGGQAILALSSAVMPLDAVRTALESTPGVQTASPVVITTTNRFGGYPMIFGIEPDSYQKVGRGALEILEGEPLTNPFDLVVDRRMARAEDLAVGDEVELLERTFRISGIVRDGAGVRLYLPIGTLHELLGREDKASVFFVRTRDSATNGDIIARLERTPALEGYKIIGNDDYAELLGTSTTGLNEFITTVVAISLLFGFLIVSLAMYTSIVERTRQIGVLKSLGAGRLFIVRAFVLEASLMAAFGIPLGYAAAWVAKEILHVTFPTLIISFTPEWLAYAALVAVVGGVLGSLYPAYRASRVDPVVALSVE